MYHIRALSRGKVRVLRITRLLYGEEIEPLNKNYMGLTTKGHAQRPRLPVDKLRGGTPKLDFSSDGPLPGY